MAYVRRHWLSSALYLFIIFAGLAVALTPTIFSGASLKEAHGQAEAQAAADPPKPVDPYLWTRVQKLRRELSLSNRDLAAMGCDEASATAVLETMKTWCTTNQAALDQLHRDTLLAKAAQRETVRKINVGPAPGSDPDPSLVNTLRDQQQTLSKLGEQRKTLLDHLVAQVETKLDTTQQHTWQAARQNAGMPGSFDYTPDLSDPQRQAIAARLKADRTKTDRGTAALESALTQELTWPQIQAVDTAKQNITLKAAAVRNAEAKALPTPAVLQVNNQEIAEAVTR